MLTAGQKAVIAALKHAGYPINRENYIGFAYGDDAPVPWTAEDEAELPDFLQAGGEVAQTSESPPAPNGGA